MEYYNILIFKGLCDIFLKETFLVATGGKT